MIELNPRSMSVTIVLAGLCVLLLGCPPKNTQSSSQQGGAGEPGGEDDRPIVMDGGSFKVSWGVKSGGLDNGFDMDDGLFKHSKNGTANLIKCTLGAQFEVKRKVDKPLVVVISLDATNYGVLQASTKKTGKHVVMALVREYDPSSSANELKHPDPNAKIKQVVLENVVLSSGSLPPNCSLNSAGTGISCDTSGVTGPRVEIHVCQGNNCADPAL